MMIMPLKESKGQKMVLPIGFWLGNDLRTSASFTTATKGLSNVSLSLKSRPLFNGIPSAANVPGATMESTTLGARVQSGCAGNSRGIDVSGWRHGCAGCQHAG